MTRVLVAGATGYLGRFVAREIASRGHFVRAVVRSPEKLDDLEHELAEIVRAEVTRPESLDHVCEGIDVVFSSVGITRQKDGLTFRDVDYQANKNLLEAALRAGVERFIYVSVFDGPAMLQLDIIKAHEDFVEALRASGIDYSVVRPTGYFSDMGEFMAMAKKGRVFLIGDGKHRSNPIHGADLAKTCADALQTGPKEIDVGGPEVFTFREVAELAFQALGKPARITRVPVWTLKATAALTRLFGRHRAELLAFFTTAMTRDSVAPLSGTHTLEAHFRSLATAP